MRARRQGPAGRVQAVASATYGQTDKQAAMATNDVAAQKACATAITKASKLRGRADEILGRQGLSQDKFDVAVRLLAKAASTLALADQADAGVQLESGLVSAVQARAASGRVVEAPGADDGAALAADAGDTATAGDRAVEGGGEGAAETLPAALPTTFDRQYAAFALERKRDETDDANFPPNLHAACELLSRVGAAGQLQQCMQCINAYLKILQQGPDGKTTQSMGRACICWNCGHVGLPFNAAKCGEGSEVPGDCKMCRNTEQTNFVRVAKPDGTIIPWIEAKTGMSGRGKRVKPNEKCPCGSGKKYKRCCGQFQEAVVGGI